MERMHAAPRAGYASAAADSYGAYPPAPAEEDLLPALMDELSFFQDARPAGGAPGGYRAAPAPAAAAAAAAAAHAHATRPLEQPRSPPPPRRVDVDALLGAGLDTAALLAQLEAALLVRGAPRGRAHTRTRAQSAKRKCSGSLANPALPRAHARVCIAALLRALR
jgi:hypothetical protein